MLIAIAFLCIFIVHFYLSTLSCFVFSARLSLVQFHYIMDLHAIRFFVFFECNSCYLLTALHCCCFFFVVVVVLAACICVRQRVVQKCSPRTFFPVSLSYCTRTSWATAKKERNMKTGGFKTLKKLIAQRAMASRNATFVANTHTIHPMNIKHFARAWRGKKRANSNVLQESSSSFRMYIYIFIHLFPHSLTILANSCLADSFA